MIAAEPPVNLTWTSLFQAMCSALSKDPPKVWSQLAVLHTSLHTSEMGCRSLQLSRQACLRLASSFQQRLACRFHEGRSRECIAGCSGHD